MLDGGSSANYQLCLITFKAANDVMPVYISDFCIQVADSWEFFVQTVLSSEVAWDPQSKPPKIAKTTEIGAT